MRIAASLVVLIGCAAPAAPEPWQWQLPPGFPAPRVPADNPMSADKVELGRHLFHDARLSGNRTQSCASCHDPARAFTDGAAVSRGSTGELGRRSAMSLVNVAYHGAQTWANPSLVDLEQQAHVPLFGEHPVELGLAGRADELVARLAAEPVYQALFPAAFPDDAQPISIDNAVRALASFERTIVSGRSRVDRFLDGDTAALSEAERRGLVLLGGERLGCRTCHGGFAFTAAADRDVPFFNTGLYDVDGRGAYPARDRGLYEITGDPADVGRFKPPTLRNLALTAPYMHDGSVATLGEVLDIYARGGRRIASGPDAGDGATSPRKSPLIRGFALSADERADLLAVFDALTDEQLAADPALSDPW